MEEPQGVIRMIRTAAGFGGPYAEIMRIVCARGEKYHDRQSNGQVIFFDRLPRTAISKVVIAAIRAQPRQLWLCGGGIAFHLQDHFDSSRGEP